MDEILIKIAPAIVSLIGIFVTLLMYKFSKQQHKDSWLRNFNALHELFWSDDDFKKIRSWIACDDDYQEIAPIISKRLNSPEKISREEYIYLEKLDKFFNLLVKAVEVKEQFFNKNKLWESLYFQYWIEDIKVKDRLEMEDYLVRHYKKLKKYLKIPK